MLNLGNQSIFESVRVVQDVNVKLSQSTTYDSSRQIIVLVSDENILLFRFVEELDCKTKALTYFNENNKIIQDVYFNPTSGSWLLVVTFDNTIHIVPVLNLFKDDEEAVTNQVFASHTITSFIVPFIGPHTCSNPRSCPNEVDVQEACPFPTSVCWWQCLDGRNRAIIGYNDGCICFVDLSPNAPYITNLRMEEAVLKLDIFRDLRSELFYLLITCESKQYKLLLENKTLNYIFPSKPPDDCDIVSTPELLTKSEDQYRVQNLRNTFLLSAIHNDTEGLSVHSIDKNCTPVFVYRLLSKIENVLISSNLLYVIQRLSNVDVLQIISSHFSSVMEGDEELNKQALLGEFDFGDERVLNIYQMTTSLEKPIETTSNDNTENQGVLSFKDIKNTSEYYNYYNTNIVSSKVNVCKDFHSNFPKLSHEPCYLVTNKSLYVVKFRKRPSEIFYDAALSSDWTFCETFSKVFDLPYAKCIESYGDLLLREKKVSQALLTYNVIKLPPLTSASKLAECGETYALMHLCAIALKITYILKSKYYNRNVIRYLANDGDFRHSEHFSKTFSSMNSKSDKSPEGALCSDFVYTSNSTRLQMSPPSQFHLSNLLLLTLAEKCVNDKILLPLWTFIITNSKFHTNMASNVLSQSGLYSSALLLGLTRGDAIDCLSALVKVIGHHFDWYSEINTCLYNLSEEFLMEALIYAPLVSTDYFFEIQSKVDELQYCVLKRLEKQLNPFSPKFRPVVSLSPGVENNEIDIGRNLVETYLAVIIQLYTRMDREFINNALKSFDLTYEEHQIPEVKFDKSFSAGCSNAFCVIDNVAYGWGSNGINFSYSTSETNEAPIIRKMEFFTDLNIKVYAAKCGRQHILFLTNNGLYSIGSNRLGQLGIGDVAENALQPMLLTTFDNKHITHFECGQYHSAVVANGQLYTWGWGVFGQLGQGTIENAFLPEIVEFFNDKKIAQMALGHNHTMVLCVDKYEVTSLYVFGSNHFGQLGISDPFGENVVSKSLVPVRLYLPNNADLSVTMINTKFFSNLVVDKKNNLYTWGTSPHALRMITQAKRRTNVKQKLEESLRKEIARRTKDDGENEEVPPPELEKDFEMIDMKKEEEVAPDKPEAVNIAMQEPNYYMHPRIVDTIYVTGDIKEISSGLYHFALISSGTLYTWGKNLEYQLGNGDSERKSISFPQIVEGVSNPTHVECGADFTLVMMDDFTMKSFGGNANGQCAIPVANAHESKSGRLFCLPTTKRLLRLEGKCVISPTEVNLPRPRINLDNEPIKHLKSLPKFKSKFVKILDLEMEKDENAVDSETSLYIHYCLFLFHGLYDTNKILNFSQNRVEFHVRLLLLNFEHVTAFKVCLSTCKSSKDALKLFEFFTKDTLSTLPMKKHHIKYCIYYLLQHYLDKKFEFTDCEQYFINDLDYYLLELSFVLYLSNNNNFEFEEFFDEKFNNSSNMLLDDVNIQQDIFQLNYIDMIFENLTVKFKTVVCQKLMQKICQKD